MPMIATTTRCPSCSAPGSSARTDTSGTSRLVTPAADGWSAIASCATTLDDGLQGAARGLLDQQLGLLTVDGHEDAVDVAVLDRGTPRPRRRAPRPRRRRRAPPPASAPAGAPNCHRPANPGLLGAGAEHDLQAQGPDEQHDDDDRADDEVLVADAGGDLPAATRRTRPALKACGARSCRHLLGSRRPRGTARPGSAGAGRSA